MKVRDTFSGSGGVFVLFFLADREFCARNVEIFAIHTAVMSARPELCSVLQCYAAHGRSFSMLNKNIDMILQGMCQRETKRAPPVQRLTNRAFLYRLVRLLQQGPSVSSDGRGYYQWEIRRLGCCEAAQGRKGPHFAGEY
jgi:hypothetical protein